MNRKLRVLLAEDNPSDAELVLRAMRQSGFDFEWTRVETEQDFLEQLTPELDIILSDYEMPSFDAPRALALLQKSGHDIPFIIISGTIGEEVAVEMMRIGATDYLLKDRLARLGISIKQALDQGQLRMERVRAADALKQSEQELRKLMAELEIERAHLTAAQSVAKTGSWDTNITTMMVIWSAETYRIFEVTPEKFQPTHENFLSLVHPADRAAVDLAFNQSLDQRGVNSLEHRLLLQDGRIKFVEEHWQVFHDEQGRASRALGTCRDITERKLAEDALRESEERFRQIAENIQEVFWISDIQKGTVFYISPAYERIWGRSCESLLKAPRNWLEAIHPDDRERVQNAALTRQMDGGYDEEYRILRPDGALRWIRDRAFPVCNTAGQVYRIVGVAQDITERKNAGDRMREQASLLDKARDAILVRHLEHGITYWNKSAELLYGWTLEEVRGRQAADFMYLDLTAYQQAVATVLSQGEWSGEIQQITKSGDSITVEGRWTLVRDEAGGPQAVLAINSDITGKKKMEQQFLRAQRMESIGTLAGGIAHDLNNVLAPILMSIDLLRLTSRDERSQAVLSTIETSARRGADMVQQILSFARGVEGRRMLINIRTIIEDLQHLVQDTFPKDIRFQAEFGVDLPLFSGDHTQVHQVLLNLCVNARDAMPRGGTLRVAASCLEVDSNYASMTQDSKPGRYIMVKVTDTGVGIPQNLLERIFDPFFTTKDLGKGTGLGLSTVLAIVKSHGGFLNVYSEPGNGTTFSACFPAAEGLNDAPVEAADDKHPRGNGELILIVDDEAAVRTITQQTLESFGYRVITASDGTEAVALYSMHRGEVAAVVTDMMMPVMSGQVTIQVLKRLDPDVRIIAASGLSSESSSVRAESLGVTHFLPKPFTAQAILTALQEVIPRGA